MRDRVGKTDRQRGREGEGEKEKAYVFVKLVEVLKACCPKKDIKL